MYKYFAAKTRARGRRVQLRACRVLALYVPRDQPPLPVPTHPHPHPNPPPNSQRSPRHILTNSIFPVASIAGRVCVVFDGVASAASWFGMCACALCVCVSVCLDDLVDLPWAHVIRTGRIARDRNQRVTWTCTSGARRVCQACADAITLSVAVACSCTSRAWAPSSPSRVSRHNLMILSNHEKKTTIL